MFRKMRRIKQALSLEETVQILKRGASGVLAVAGDDDYPYAVPLCYAYHDNKIFFHCARSGHKLDAIARNEKVSFCVIDKDQVVPDEYTTYFQSVIVFGKAHIIEDEDEKRNALEILAMKYSPDHGKVRRSQSIEKDLNRTGIIAVTIEYMTGKRATELI